MRLYTFLSQITPWQAADFEKLYSFGLLLTRLPSEGGGAPPDLEGDVQLQYYRIHRTRDEVKIQLLAGEGGTVKGPTAVGTRKAEEPELLLSQIIDVLNERFGTNFTPEDQLFFDQIAQKAKKAKRWFSGLTRTISTTSGRKSLTS